MICRKYSDSCVFCARLKYTIPGITMDNAIQVVFEEVSRDYRTEIPNIVFELLASKKISIYAFTLYCVYRRTAGTQGRCWKGMRALAKECGSSLSKISESREELAKQFEELNGQSLIVIIPGCKKKNISDTVLIRDIWASNHKRFVKNKLTCSQWEQGCSHWEQKKEHYKNDDDDDMRASAKSIDHSSSKDHTPAQNHQIPEGAMDLEFTTPRGKKLSLSPSAIYRHFINKPYKTETITEAIQRARDQNSPVTNMLHYLESVCESIERAAATKEAENKPQPAKYQEKKKTKPTSKAFTNEESNIPKKPEVGIPLLRIFKRNEK